MFNHILVPIDGSGRAAKSARWAANMGEVLGASLTLLTVVDPSKPKFHESPGPGRRFAGTGIGGTVSAVGISLGAATPRVDTTTTQLTEPPEVDVHPLDLAVQSARDYLENLADQIAADGLEVNTEVAVGEPYIEIYSVGSRRGADVAVMATHGRTRLGRAALGSVTDRVIHQQFMPVLALPPEYLDIEGNPGIPENIIVPLDGSNAAASALNAARALAKQTSGNISVVTAVDRNPGIFGDEVSIEKARGEAEDYLIQVTAQLEADGFKSDSSVLVGDAADAIIDVVEAKLDPMVVMTTHGETGFRRWFVGSVADKVVRMSQVPVLLLAAP